MSGFFSKLRSGIERFMYGRNGADQLCVALLVCYVLLTLLQTILVILFPFQQLVSNVTSALLLVIAMVMMFRIFSRNLEKRRRENQRFLSWWAPKQRAFAAWRCRARDKDHKYFRCGQCGVWCRVPRGKGRIEITCPKCGRKINGKS